MSGHTNSAQIVKMGGKPAFAIIPYDEYLRLIESDDADGTALILHEVVGLVVEKGINLVKAWRIHLGLTQKEAAARAGISQAAVSQMERTDVLVVLQAPGNAADALPCERLRFFNAVQRHCHKSAARFYGKPRHGSNRTTPCSLSID